MNEPLKAIATRINAVVDIPVFSEPVEQTLIEAALEVGLSFLPPQYLRWLMNAADGIDDSEAKDVSDWLCELMKKHSNIPDFLCGFAAQAIVGLMRKGASLLTS